MPTKRRRISRERRGSIHPRVLAYFASGYERSIQFFPSAAGLPSDPEEADAALRSLWFEHGPEFVRSWVDEHPGTRPGAWWIYDAPDRRRVADARGQVPLEDLAHIRGAPRTWRPAVTPEPWSEFSWYAIDEASATQFRCDAARPPAVEAEAEFLRRHRLFLRGELVRLTGCDFAPWTVGPVAPEPSWVAPMRALRAQSEVRS